MLLQNERESSQEDLSNRIAPNTLHLHNTWAVKRTYESTGNNIVSKWDDGAMHGRFGQFMLMLLIHVVVVHKTILSRIKPVPVG